MPTPPHPENPRTDTAVRSRPRPAINSRARSGGEPVKNSGRRTGRAFSLSVAIHLAVAAIVLQLLTFGHGLYSFIDPFGRETPVEERLTYVEPVAPEVPPTVTSAVAPVAPVPPRPSVGPVVAPGTPQITRPSNPVDTGGGAGVSAGSGSGNAGVGAVDPNLRGAKPGYNDGRVWMPGAPRGAAASRDGADNLDSVISSVLTLAADSLDSIARANGAYGRRPGDWTKTDKDGRKWGWDNAGIRLGKVVIPNALLTLLPANIQSQMSGNAISIDRERRLAMSREDIQRNMTMGPGDADFNKLKDELRQRREKERRDRLRAPEAPTVPPPKGGSDK